MITIKREFKIPTRTKHFPNTITSDNANSNANQLINQVICITNNECLILHHNAFRADYISCSSRTQRCANSSTARNLVLREFLIQVRYIKVAVIDILLEMYFRTIRDIIVLPYKCINLF